MTVDQSKPSDFESPVGEAPIPHHPNASTLNYRELRR